MQVSARRLCNKASGAKTVVYCTSCCIRALQGVCRMFHAIVWLAQYTEWARWQDNIRACTRPYACCIQTAYSTASYAHTVIHVRPQSPQNTVQAPTKLPLTSQSTNIQVASPHPSAPYVDCDSQRELLCLVCAFVE